ncbi:MAG: long-chain fatty acid--CoA ligase [Candidatus Caldarchaeales archaeon]
MSSEKPWFKNWPESIPKSLEYPKVPLYSLLEKTAQEFPDRDAIIFLGKKISYRELNRLVNRFATALYGMGIRKGDVVGLYLPNMPQFVIAYYGALKIGAIVTGINPLFVERELEFQLSDSEAKAIVILDTLFPRFEKVWEKTQVRSVIIVRLAEYIPKIKSILEILSKKMSKVEIAPRENIYFFGKALKMALEEPPRIDIDPEKDLAALQYTGGTTGLPKGAMLTHFNLVSNAVSFAAWLKVKRGGEVGLSVLPLFHIYGMTVAMNLLIYAGGTMVLLPRFQLIDVLKSIERYKVTLFPGVPTMYALIVDHPEARKYNLNSIRFCISGASPLPPEVQKRFMEMTGAVLVEGYGLTEASPVTHCNPFDPTMKTVKIGSIGIPLPDTDAKIVDLETGEHEMPIGEVGEIVIKGPQIMKGYWKRPEESVEALRDGWLHTGDLGKMDEDGYFYIIDRKKDLIKYKGYSIYPRELEDIIYEHPAVKLVAVVGKPDPVSGELPKAFIVLKEGAVATGEEIMKFVNERVAPYKAIREVEFRKELPLTSVGKILKRVLREEEKKKVQNIP